MSPPATKKTKQDLIKPKLIYIVDAVPEPFTDEEWFATAKQHASYDPTKLPARQLTIQHSLGDEDIKMRRGKLAIPNQQFSLCMNYTTGKHIQRPMFGWLCLAEDQLYYFGTYNDMGLKHRKPNKPSGSSRKNAMVTRSFSKRTRRTEKVYDKRLGRMIDKRVCEDRRWRRYYLITATKEMAAPLAAEMIRHAFGE